MTIRRHIRTALLAASGGLLLFTGAPANAMPPAHGLDGREQRAAERALDAAHQRGVGELPASPFLRQTSCGRAAAVLRNRTARHRAAKAAVRRAMRRGSGVVAARRSLRSHVRAVVAARRAHARACKPSSRRALRDQELGTLRGTVTTQRPQSVLRGRGMVIALPIDFRDVAARRSTNTPTRYERLFFDDSYPHGGGSLATFWRDMSFGSFTVAGDVADWRRVPGTRASYAKDAGGMGAYPSNSQALLEDAVRANDASVDFARYDNDGPDGRANSGDDDGVVDAVFLVYAGTSAAENGNLDAMWPHAWQHTVATRDRSANGGMIRVGRYAALPERMEHSGPDGDLLTVGVAAHEYGHVLGLPDLIDGEDGAGAGQWDLMGSGMWGFEHSSRPTGLSAWSRARLGWLTPQLLEGDHLGHALGSSYAQRSAVKLPVEGEPLSEHFLVERRTRTGFDSDAPGSGLLVWHVDDSIAADDASGHPRVELVAADGRASGDGGDLLTSGTHLSDASTPSTRAHDGGDSLVAIQNVQDATVDLHAGKASLAPAIDRAIDLAGPQAAPPVSAITSPANGARLRGIVTVTCTASGSPNLKTIQWQVDGGNAGQNNISPTVPSIVDTYSWDTTGETDGTHTFGCRVRNTSNQWSDPTVGQITVTIDNTAPGTPSITAPTAGAWLRGTVSFTATGTDAPYGVTRFNYLVDGGTNWQGPWAEATPQTQSYAWDTTLVADGAHSLTVQSEDLAGNQSAISAVVAVNVDNTLPTMTAPRDGSVAPDTDTQASITTLNANWDAGSDTFSGIASYSWRFCTTVACGSVVASGSGTGLAASATGLSLTDGTYYACVRPVDVAGNQGAEQCSDGVAVDATAPTMPTPDDGAGADIDGQASASALSANWTPAGDGTGSGVTSYDWQFCTSPVCGSVLASGSGAGLTASATGLTLTAGSTYYACVRARDAVNNVSAYVCSDGVTVDNAPPVVSVPNDGSIAPDQDFQASTSTLAANWAAATDASGVSGYDWRFCTTPACGTVLASGSGAGLGASAGSLSLTNGTTYYACIRATDVLANVSGWTCSDGTSVDTAVPGTTAPNDGSAGDIDTQVSTTQLDANWVAGSDGAGSGVASYDWRFCATDTLCGTVVTSGTTAGLTASASSLSLSVGTTYFACVRATDVVGNIGSWTCSDGVVVNDGPPVMSTPTDGSVLPDEDFQTSTTTLDAAWPAATDGNGVSGYDWRFCTTPACGTILASGSSAGLTASAGSLALSNGTTYYACVRATDTTATSSAYSCSDGINVDTAGPTAAVPSDGTAGDIDTQVSTTQLDANWAAANDGTGSGVASYDWRFCDSATCTGTILASGGGVGTTATAGSLALAAGTTYFACVRATDQLGNVGAWTCSDGVQTDSAPTMSTPTDGSVLPDLDFQLSTTSLSATWPAATDDIAVTGYDWRFCDSPTCGGTILASGSTAGTSATAGALALANGTTYYACVRATDGVPQSSAYVCSDGVTVDTAAPTMPTPQDGTAADIDAQGSATQLDANWSAATDGTGSGVASYDWRFCDSATCTGTIVASGSGAGTSASAGSLTLTLGATYYACVRALDQLANTSAWSCSDGVVTGDPAPTMSTPTDGSALPDLDAQSSLTTLSAIWPAATDNGSVTGYDWRFCATSAACGTIVASGSGAGLSATAGALALTAGTTYYACVRATDDAANQSAWVCSDGILVDTTAPTTSHGGISGTVSGWVNLTSSSSDAGGLDRVEYRIDAVTRATTPAGGATTFNDGGTPFDTTTMADGNHGYRIATYDVAGNVVLSNPSTQFVINNNPEAVLPTGSITSPAGGALAPIQTLTATVGDDSAIVLVEWLLDGALIGGITVDRPLGGSAQATSMTSNKSWNTGAVGAGAHTLTVRVTDASGNVYVTPGVAVTK